MRFEPIAIVGQSCLLPGSNSPEQLWANVLAGRDLVSEAPGKRWGLDAAHVMGSGPDRAVSNRGGYVSGFEELFVADGFAITPEEIHGLDPLFKWVLHAGREALVGVQGPTERAGAILGNLSFPSSALSRLAESTWLAQAPTALRSQAASIDARNRFMSGLPAHLLAKALGLGAGAFALDAACASSLYAIKLACDRLHDGEADLMLAGAVNRADDLFIHVGFSALQALSPTGQSRPFHQGADGLVPAEGVAIVALKRLADAVRDGDTIAGVIRGVGLSNDGRGRGMLAPSSEGQVRAMLEAYAQAELEPTDISLVECHATGTVVGDTTELESMGRVFAGHTDLPIGSLKSNMGHLITAAGGAALIKVLAAMKAETRPPTLHVEDPLAALSASPFRPLQAAEPWPGDKPRRAAISAFGFGGNNAHLIVEEWTGTSPGTSSTPVAQEPIAIVGLGARVGDTESAQEFAEALNSGRSSRQAATVKLHLSGLKFPPNDIAQSLAQQLLLIEAAREAVAGVGQLPRERSSVLIGMQCDAEVARYGMRWRLAQWAPEGTDQAWLDQARDAVLPALQSAGVVGNMPNIVANRLNSQFDLGGPSLTISSEEISGLIALKLASRQLRNHEVDAAIVGAVDLCCEPVQAAASAILPADRRTPGDAAVCLVLKRLADAERDGDTILAVLGESAEPQLHLGLAPTATALNEQFGHAHAASGLVHAAAAIIACRTGVRPGGHPWTGEARIAKVSIQTQEGQGSAVQFRAHGAPAPLPAPSSREGPVLTRPAHPAPIVLPSPEATVMATAHSHTTSPSPSANIQIMAPAPTLVPTSYDEPHQAPAQMASAPVAQPIPPTPQPAVATTPLAVPAQPFTSPVGETLVEHQRLVGQLHQDYLRKNAEVHARFLAMRQQGVQTLLQAAGSAPGISALQAPHPMPAPPSAPVITKTPVPVSTPIKRIIPEPSSVQHKPVFKQEPPKPTQVVKPSAPAKPKPTGLTLNREQLKTHASGKISEIYGPLFEQQDGYALQVRMPEPPLLLADRMTGITGEPGAMGKGTIWTETDITHDSWYLNQGYMPAGVLIEAGQADLMLISWLGIDSLNQGERAYRLLGCDLTYHRRLPCPGETLAYDIHVDGHAQQGDITLFFFHYDCHVGDERQISVRNGQAGFFNADELAESAGILWTPEDGDFDGEARLDAPLIPCEHQAFDAAQIASFASGDAYGCFGNGFEILQTHNRTPKIQSGKMQFLHRITDFHIDGGPWKRGYLRAEQDISADDWFFDGHFKNDPCMPGTLMFEGCVQAMAVYLAGLGYTVDKDGWRFEPVPEHTIPLRCRGQVTPTAKDLVYEVFVEEVHDGPYPTLYADLLCTIDGLKCFHARRVGLRLVPDWPLTSKPEILANYTEPKPVASKNGFDFDYGALLACAWGKPSEAFGPMYEPFDDTRRVARLPGPPYHFMSRVSRIDGDIGAVKPGAIIEIEYDVPEDYWYFDENGCRTMPYAVFLEAALQPCGWLASFVGSALTTETDLCFRNLDGTSTLTAEVFPTSGTLRTVVNITNISQSAGMIIENFEVQCYIGDTQVYDMTTVFGFFPKEALANQLGIIPTPEERARRDEACDYLVDLKPQPERYCGGELRLPKPMLLMLDRITGYWPEGGAHGLGRIRAEKDVDPAEWFFKAHFFQDPVQPGSLGLEAMLQLIQFYILESGVAEGIENPRFEPIALNEPMTWKYRGQVVPKNKTIYSDMDIVSVNREEDSVTVIAEGFLWVDELRIYQAKNMGMRVVSGKLPEPNHEDFADEVIVDPARDRWLLDHCPTWTVPALPMMDLVDRMAQAARQHSPNKQVIGLRDVAVHRWVSVDGPTRLKTETTPTEKGVEVELLVWREAANPELSRFERAASATVLLGDYISGEATLAPLTDAVLVPDPYGSGALFHGPAFQLMTKLERSSTGARGTMKAASAEIPNSLLNPALLDASTHVIPHDALQLWSEDIAEELVAYPYRITKLELFKAAPTSGEATVAARFDGFADEGRMPQFTVEISHEGQLWCRYQLTEILMPKGPIGMARAAERRKFLRDRLPVPGLGLSRFEGKQTIAEAAIIKGSNWLPGTVEQTYGATESLLEAVAIGDHVGQLAGVHPSAIRLDDELARSAHQPYTRYPIAIQSGASQAIATSTGAPIWYSEPIRAYWEQLLGKTNWIVEDLVFGLVERFVRRVHLEDPAAMASLNGRGVLYLGNHQTGIESVLFSVITSALGGVTTAALAKNEHRETWLGKLIELWFSYPGVTDPELLFFFDRSDLGSAPKVIQQLGEEIAGNRRSVLVHVEGTRSLQCGKPVTQLSSAFVDMAIAANIPIVPVRFVGGLPTEPGDKRLEFPLEMGRQDIIFGSPIAPEALAALPLKERKEQILAAINGTGPAPEDERPFPGAPVFQAQVQAWAAQTGVSLAHSTLYQILARRNPVSPETKRLLNAAALGTLALADSATDRWLGAFAEKLFGEKGPEIRYNRRSARTNV
jgi:3-oxoacyl-(acyl-carrier-protein) synthase/3-hydroxymyristoyl/3-hydroxydecanoyl-(acyl carrier protein) dehydratase/1-acyl-sn-glycerol-3-phosphate acyltransferase